MRAAMSQRRLHLSSTLLPCPAPQCTEYKIKVLGLARTGDNALARVQSLEHNGSKKSANERQTKVHPYTPILLVNTPVAHHKYLTFTLRLIYLSIHSNWPDPPDGVLVCLSYLPRTSEIYAFRSRSGIFGLDWVIMREIGDRTLAQRNPDQASQAVGSRLEQKSRNIELRWSVHASQFA